MRSLVVALLVVVSSLSVARDVNAIQSEADVKAPVTLQLGIGMKDGGGSGVFNGNFSIPVNRSIGILMSADIGPWTDNGTRSMFLVGPQYTYLGGALFGGIGPVGGSISNVTSEYVSGVGRLSATSENFVLGVSAWVGVKIVGGFHFYMSPTVVSSLKGDSSQGFTFVRGGFGISL